MSVTELARPKSRKDLALKLKSVSQLIVLSVRSREMVQGADANEHRALDATLDSVILKVLDLATFVRVPVLTKERYNLKSNLVSGIIILVLIEDGARNMPLKKNELKSSVTRPTLPSLGVL